MTEKETKLKKDTVDYIKHVINTAHILDIDTIIIDADSTRGSNQDGGMGILTKPKKDAKFEIESIAITRIPILRSRMQLMGDDFDIIPEYKQQPDGTTSLYRLKLKKGKTSIEFKCANPAHIKIKKNMNDQSCFSFVLDVDTMKLLNRISSAMSTQNVTFSCADEKTVQIKISDSEGDIFNHLVCDEVITHLPELKTKFASTIKLKTIIPLLKEERGAEVKLTVTQRGIFLLKVNGLDCYIFPEID